MSTTAPLSGRPSGVFDREQTGMSAWHLEELKVHLAEILMGGILQ
jgi:hypothetical protein